MTKKERERGRERQRKREKETYLINVIVTREKWFALNEFRKDTTNTPNVNRVRVFVTGQHDFGRTVPARDDVFGQQHGSTTALLVLVSHAAGESEIANLEIAVGVDQQVGRFEVTMEDFARVNVFESSHDLIDKVLHVIHRQLLLGVDDSV
jgi:hypothetical protein